MQFNNVICKYVIKSVVYQSVSAKHFFVERFAKRFADWKDIWILQQTEHGEVQCNHGDAMAFQFE